MTRLEFTREEIIPKMLNGFGMQVGVEIGVFKGQFSKHLLDNWPGTLWLVDPWRAFDDEEGYVDASNHKHHQTAYLETMNRLEGLESRSFMLRGLSSDMASRFQDGELDFVYIDGNHAYDWVKEDIELWWPKVKSGGLIMGHDYLGIDNWYESEFMENGKDKHIWMHGQESDGELIYAGHFGVNTAVDEFVQSAGLELTLTSEWLGSWIVRKP
jgi:hypothetical protein